MKEIESAIKTIDAFRSDVDVKNSAKTALSLLGDSIELDNLCWVKPTVWNDADNKYVCIVWDKDTRTLILNIDDEEQWWTKIWIEGSKTKTDIADIDYSNLSKHWEWLIND